MSLRHYLIRRGTTPFKRDKLKDPYKKLCFKYIIEENTQYFYLTNLCH